MPVTKSAKRALRVSRRREVINKKVKSAYKNIIREARLGKIKNISEVYGQLDRASKKGIVHKNKAARLKSRLAKLIKPTVKTKVSKVKKKKK